MARREPGELARLVQRGLERGLDLVEAFRRADGEAARMSRDYQRAVAENALAVRRYEQRVAALRTRRTAGAGVAGVSGTVGVLDVVVEATTSGVGVYGPSWAWLAASAVSGVIALAAGRRLQGLRPPVLRQAPMPPPPPLPRGAVGETESARLATQRVQLARVLPSIQRLHPGAAAEVWRADAEAAPVLAGQVERLSVLHRITVELPGSGPAAAAATAAEEVRARLDRGCQTYDQLLSAAASMLAAPDVARSTDQVLGPAVEALTAYAHGLSRAAMDP